MNRRDVIKLAGALGMSVPLIGAGIKPSEPVKRLKWYLILGPDHPDRWTRINYWTSFYVFPDKDGWVTHLRYSEGCIDFWDVEGWFETGPLRHTYRGLASFEEATDKAEWMYNTLIEVNGQVHGNGNPEGNHMFIWGKHPNMYS